MNCKIKKKVRNPVFESLIKMASRSVLLKGGHAYRSGVKVVDRLLCKIELDNKHSDYAVVVKSGNHDIVGHIRDSRVKKLFNFLKS